MNNIQTQVCPQGKVPCPDGYNVQRLFEAFSFEVPIYQRVFTWGEPQFERLFRDLEEHFCAQEKQEPYYLGIITVVRPEKGDKLILVDGQQRLTCILLLGALLGWQLDASRLTYTSRPQDEEALAKVYSICRDGQLPNLEAISEIGNVAMADFLRFALMRKEVVEKLHNKSNAIKEHLTLMVALLPDKPYQEDIFEQNRYFEKMNYGGKQLEPPEILKAKLCKGLDAQYLGIWNSVANFGKYHAFVRSEQVQPKALSLSLSAMLGPKPTAELELVPTEHIRKMIYERCEKQFSQYDLGSEERDDLRKGVISFSMFLLHVRYLFLQKMGRENKEGIGEESHLLDLFREFENVEPHERRNFIELMDAYRQFLDLEIIHLYMAENNQRYCFYEATKDKQGKQLETRDSVTDEQKHMMQIQSMLYVSSGDKQSWILDAYKEYENAVKAGKAQWIDEGNEGDGTKNKITKNVQVLTLESLKKVVGGLLNQETTGELLKATQWPDECLRYGSDNRRWLALLDYLLWEQHESLDSFQNTIWEQLDKDEHNAVKDFAFRRNRSVEHLHPQTDNESANQETWNKLDGNGTPAKHHFGNLALISAGTNSKYSNAPVGGKADRVAELVKQQRIESIKLLLMLKACGSKDADWTPEKAQHHADEMLKVFQSFLAQFHR